MSRKFSKGLQHDSVTGLPKQEDLDQLHDLISSNLKPTGLKTPNRKIVSPDAAKDDEVYELTPNPPAFHSEELAEDMIKVYADALKTNDPLPAGELSVFLKTEAKIGSIEISTRNLELESDAMAGLTNQEYLDIQNGLIPPKSVTTSVVPEISTYGHLAAFVHNDKDLHYQVAYHKLLNLNTPFNKSATRDDNSRHWADFVWFNAPYHCRLMSEVLHKSLIFAWKSKFTYNLPRPEVYGYVLENHPDELLHSHLIKNSPEGQAYFNQFGTYLLKQYYPEGSPAHPSFPQGHQSVAFGVCFVLRYIYDTDADFVVDGVTYNVGEELKKLAYNIAYARTYAGVHYYCDTDSAIEAAEANAAKIIREINKEYGYEVNTHTVIGATGKVYTV